MSPSHHFSPRIIGPQKDDVFYLEGMHAPQPDALGNIMLRCYTWHSPMVRAALFHSRDRFGRCGPRSNVCARQVQGVDIELVVDGFVHGEKVSRVARINGVFAISEKN